MEGTKNKRERSTLYPAITVDECFEKIELIDKIEGKLYPDNSIAQAIGMSEKTNFFRSTMSALRQYGLIIKSQGDYKLTERSYEYLHKSKDEQKKDIKLQAFLNAPLYKKLVEKYENQVLPPTDELAEVLLGQEFGLTNKTKDLAAEIFLKSLEQLNLLENEVLVTNLSENKTKTSSKGERKLIRKKIKKEQQDAKKSEGYYNFEIPTLSGENALIKIPQNVSEKDLEFIQLYVENMLPVFLKNLRSEK